MGAPMRAQAELVAAPPGRERLARQAVQVAAVGVLLAARALVAAAPPVREALAGLLALRLVARGRNFPDVATQVALPAGLVEPPVRVRVRVRLWVRQQAWPVREEPQRRGRGPRKTGCQA